VAAVKQINDSPQGRQGKKKIKTYSPAETQRKQKIEFTTEDTEEHREQNKSIIPFLKIK
jgi:hypothetical protein